MTDDKYGQGRTLDAMNARGLAGKRDYVRSLEQRRDEEAMSLLVECLCDESWYLRELAENALLRLGPGRRTLASRAGVVVLARRARLGRLGTPGGGSAPVATQRHRRAGGGPGQAGPPGGSARIAWSCRQRATTPRLRASRLDRPLHDRPAHDPQRRPDDHEDPANCATTASSSASEERSRMGGPYRAAGAARQPAVPVSGRRRCAPLSPSGRARCAAGPVRRAGRAGRPRADRRAARGGAAAFRVGAASPSSARARRPRTARAHTPARADLAGLGSRW
jgi:hypothetical protein